ncbi:MAG: hypothetical protein QNJ40_18110 [Xanthomonadales bacterium]|nr:hypothetical protein [Xanthomonadales bacterium]
MKTCLSAILITFSLTGCLLNELSGRLPSSAVDFNRSVAKAQNEILLLNVLRAAYGRPQYYSEITKVSGSANLALESGGLGYQSSTQTTRELDDMQQQLGGIGGAVTTRGNSVAPAVKFSQSPSFDMAFPRSKDYTKGILSSVNPDTVNQLLDMGWDSQLLAALLVAEIGKSDGNCLRPSADDHDANCEPIGFERLAGLDPVRFKRSTTYQCLGNPLTAKEFRDFRGLAAVFEQGLVVVNGEKCPENKDRCESKETNTDEVCKQRFMAKKNPESWYLELSQTKANTLGCKGGTAAREIPGSGEASDGDGVATIDAPATKVGDAKALFVVSARSDKEADETDTKAQCSITLRSPDEVLYFLGEIARCTIVKESDIKDKKDQGKNKEMDQTCNRYDDVFKVFKGRFFTEGSVYVEFLGQDYHVPVETENVLEQTDVGVLQRRPTVALKLVNLVFGLQASTEDLVSTGSVRIVGGN